MLHIKPRPPRTHTHIPFNVFYRYTMCVPLLHYQHTVLHRVQCSLRYYLLEHHKVTPNLVTSTIFLPTHFGCVLQRQMNNTVVHLLVFTSKIYGFVSFISFLQTFRPLPVPLPPHMCAGQLGSWEVPYIDLFVCLFLGY